MFSENIFIAIARAENINIYGNGLSMYFINCKAWGFGPKMSLQHFFHEGSICGVTENSPFGVSSYNSHITFYVVFGFKQEKLTCNSSALIMEPKPTPVHTAGPVFLQDQFPILS